jgi:hypothetical protein
MKQTLSILWWLVEIAAVIRSAIATFLVVESITHDFVFTIFTVATIEGLFLSSLFLVRAESVAPISALLALVFAGAMQYFELRVLDGSITPQEKDILRYAVAFAPVVILILSYLRHLVAGAENPLPDLLNKVSSKLSNSEKTRSTNFQVSKPRGRPRGSRNE